MSNKRNRKLMMSICMIFSLAFSLATGNVSEAASCKLNKSKLCLEKGDCSTLKVKGCSGSVNWSSSDKKVATVSKKGKVTAKKNGTATITAKCGNKKSCCKVTVKKAEKTKSSCSSCTTISGLPFSFTPSTATTKPATATPKPAATTKPVATAKPAVTAKPVATATPTVNTNTSTNTGTVTEASAYQTLNSLRSTYPEGMSLTNSNYYYYSPVFGHGYGCYGFAAKLSDTIFGTTKKYTTHTNFANIRVGDNIRIGNRHSVICLTKQSDYITVVEGNYNSSVHWDRKITKSSLQSDGFVVYTRY